MTQKTHKITFAALNALAIAGSFVGLIAILDLNEPTLYIKTAFIVWLFFLLEIALLYDLHFKKHRGFKELRKRFDHLWEKKFVKAWLHYLILPGLIYWGSLGIFFLNFGFPKIQQIVAGFSSIAIFLNFLYLKEIFSRGKEEVDSDIFVILSVVKIYAATLVFAASLGIVKSYCLETPYFVLAVFCLSFLLVYQALFQHRLISTRNLGKTLLISLAMALAAFAVLVFWNHNYFTAAVLLTVCYNLMWGIFHYHLDRALTLKAFWEIVIISVIVAGMIFSTTNFRARILDACQYRL